MLFARKYRLYPTEKQKELLAKSFGCTRFVYNHFLELRNTLYQDNKQSLSCYKMMSMLPPLKKEYPWLTEVCANSLQSALCRLDNAFTRFFHNQAQYPKFKKKGDKDSFSEPGGIEIRGDKLVIPKFREGIKLVQHRPFDGVIKGATISCSSTNKYFVSLTIESQDAVLVKRKQLPETTIGIDLGIKIFATFDDGKKIDNPKYLKRSLANLAVQQERLSRMKKGSNNRKKQQLKVAKIYEKVANQRKDFLHKLTYKLTHESQVGTICIEDLDVKSLLEERKLSREIADASWSEFRRQLTYKCDWYGVNLVVISRYAPSTKLCPTCGHINESLALSDREWTCPKCHTHYDRDINAAQNIRRFGLEQVYRSYYKQ